MIKHTLLIITILSSILGFSQMIPGEEENIPFLITFGNKADIAYGDDDSKQTFFFILPTSVTNPFYIRIFDPEISGANDELIGVFDTKTRFSVYGGDDVYSSVKGVNANKKSELPSGELLHKVEFDSTSEYDEKWYSIGPFNPAEGEFIKEQDGYIFKITAEGIAGNDGNIYKYFLSSEENKNTPIPGANAFTFEYTVRLHESSSQISHLYPYVDNNVLALKQHNFDLDGVCDISIYSIEKAAEKGECSGNSEWAESLHHVKESEREACMDFQLINNHSGTAKNNNVVLYITNQYGEFLPFMTVPLGDFKPRRTIKIK